VAKLRKRRRRRKLRGLDILGKLLLRHADGPTADAEAMVGQLAGITENVDL
jgi:hypothetical protein